MLNKNVISLWTRENNINDPMRRVCRINLLAAGTDNVTEHVCDVDRV